MVGTSTAELFDPRHRALTAGLVLTIILVAFEALAVVTTGQGGSTSALQLSDSWEPPSAPASVVRS